MVLRSNGSQARVAVNSTSNSCSKETDNTRIGSNGRVRCDKIRYNLCEYPKTVIMEGNQTALLSSIAEDMKAPKDSFESLNTTVNGLEDKIMSQIRGTIREETRKFSD